MADFIGKLCDWLAPRAQLAVVQESDPIRLWAHAIEELPDAPIDAVVSRLTRYDGRPIQTAPVGHSVIQCYTVHRSSAQAMAQAEKLRAALCDGDGMPVREVAISGFVIKAVSNATVPSYIGRDDRMRAEIVFNFEVHHIPA